MKKLIVAVLSLLINLSSAWPTLADELIISGNGDNSQNQVSITSSQTTTVEQANNANVSNDLTSTASTGDNSVSLNTGDPSITTGNIQATTAVENNLVNSSVTQVGCCPDPTQVTISDNGASSTNQVDLTQTSQTTALVYQDATIVNSVTGYANTGLNSANHNNGDVSISTGDIVARVILANDGINLAKVQTPAGNSAVAVAIWGNGAFSTNQVNSSASQQSNVYITNQANILNLVSWYANTGLNSASGNSGNVSITTGDILLDILIRNRVNLAEVKIDCCPGGGPDDPGDNNPPPPGDDDRDDNDDANDDNDDDNDGDNGNGNGGGPGEVAGATMPATGNNLMLGLVFAALTVFMIGLHLRVNAGSAPPFIINTRKFRY